MTNKSGSGKKADAAKKASQEKSGKSARGRTIELTAEDVTPSDAKTSTTASSGDKVAAEPAAEKDSKSKASKPTPEEPRSKQAGAAPAVQVVKRGGFGLFLVSTLCGAALALGIAYGLLVSKVISLPDDGRAQMQDAIARIKTQVTQSAKRTESRLAEFDANAKGKAQLYSDLLNRANGALSALRNDLAGVKAQVAELATTSRNNAKSLAAINTAAQSALKATEDLALRLGEEGKARAKLGPSIAANTAQVQKRAVEIAGLSGDLRTVKSETGRLAARVDDVFRGLKDIEKAVVEAGARSGGAPSSAGVRISLLGNKLKRLEQDMAGLRNTLKSLPAMPPDFTPQIALLEKSQARLAKGLGDLGARDAARENALQHLQSQTGALGREIGKIASLNTRLADLGRKLEALQVNLGIVGKAADTLKIGKGGNSGALNALAEEIRSVRRELAGKIDRVEKLTKGMADAESKLRVIDARLKDVKSVQAALAAQQRQAAKVQGASRLQRALLGGGAYKEALFAFMELAPEVKVPESVNAMAANGILTLAELRKRFSVLRESLEAQNILEGGSGLMGKIMKSAGSVVTIRRTGPTAGMSTGAIASRIAAHLEAGKLALALKEAEAFKGEARNKAAAWIKQARARLDAEKFAADLGALVYAGGKGE